MIKRKEKSERKKLIFQDNLIGEIISLEKNNVFTKPEA